MITLCRTLLTVSVLALLTPAFGSAAGADLPDARSSADGAQEVVPLDALLAPPLTRAVLDARQGSSREAGEAAPATGRTEPVELSVALVCPPELCTRDRDCSCGACEGFVCESGW